jgi:hypothetical protein
MLNRLKRVLVKSFIGAIALGYLFAEAILYFVNIFTAPITAWITQKLYVGLLVSPSTASRGLPLQAALPQALGFLVLLLVWYGLLRWLYFTPLVEETVANSQ